MQQISEKCMFNSFVDKKVWNYTKYCHVDSYDEVGVNRSSKERKWMNGVEYNALLNPL